MSIELVEISCKQYKQKGPKYFRAFFNFVIDPVCLFMAAQG